MLYEITIRPNERSRKQRTGLDTLRGRTYDQIILAHFDNDWHRDRRADVTFILRKGEDLTVLTGQLDGHDYALLCAELRQLIPPGQRIITV